MVLTPMAYYGGKTRMAPVIASLLPKHGHYVEPYCGALSVLLAKPRSRMETVNDLDGLLMTFWRVLRDEPDELRRRCALTPHSRAEYLAARDADLSDLDDVERARLVWLMIAQGRSGTLRATGWRAFIDPSNSSQGMARTCEAYVDRMSAAAERLHNVSLECRPALEIIGQYGQHGGVCMYVDPPYLGATRSKTSGNGYRVDMRDEADHKELLAALLDCKASVVLSGYDSPLYNDALSDWDVTRLETVTTQGAGRGARRVEVVWCNRPLRVQRQLDYTEAG